MNQAYRLVWNTTQQVWVVAGELAKGRKKSSGRAFRAAMLLVAGMGAANVQAAPAVDALPMGESVVGNPVSFDRSVTNQLTVTQSGMAGVINWQSFNVGKDAKVIFNQPSSDSYVFNNVWGGSPSEIFGRIESNGQFVINNPAGVTFGAGSQVNASAIVAATANNTSAPFYTNHFSLNTLSANKVENYGTLIATSGGVTLLAAQVVNGGTITATGGNAGLINAHDVSFADSIPTINTASALAGSIQSSGNITATQVSSVGGKILLTGDTSQAASQIQLTGDLQAEQTLVNGRSILVNGVLNLNGSSNSLDFTSTDGYRLSSASVLNLNGASSSFSVNGSAYTVVRNVSQLQDVSADLAGQYVLANDIDASASNGWNSGSGFAPLGDSTTPFSGKLDGLGHAVKGLFINRSSSDHVGLLGYAQNASLRNIGLTNASIVGQSSVGGLLGYLNTTLGASSGIENSYVSGSVIAGSSGGGLLGSNNNTGGTVNLNLNYSRGEVTGGGSLGGLIGYSLTQDGGYTLVSNSYSDSGVTANGSYAGGLMGWNYATTAGSIATSSAVSNSYATGKVSAPNGIRVGGLLGVNLATNSVSATATVSSSYASGAVAGDSSVGGLIGTNADYASASNNYWDASTTEQASGIGTDTGLSSNIVAVSGNGGANPSAYAQASYTNFDFNNNWFIAQGASRPMLRAFLNTADSDGRIAVSNLYQLQGMAANLAGSYYLTQDIDASLTASSVAAGNLNNRADVWAGRGFAPVGDSVNYFSGTLDGNSHVIDSLNINRTSTNYVGLFGNALNSNMQNIGLTNVDIRGYQYVGALLGQSVASSGQAVLIRNSFSQGSVSGQNSVGGLIGQLYSGNGSMLIQDVQTSGQIATVSYSGGVVGNITALNGVASIQLDRNFSNAALSGSLGRGALAGLVATEDGGNAGISNSYWDYQANGLGNAVGLSSFATLTNVSSLTTLLSKKLSSYASWGSNIDAQGGTGSAWRIYEGQTAPLLRSFLKQVNVNIGNASKTYDGTAYSGGNGYNLSNPAASLLGSISYAGTAQGARNAGSYSLSGSGLYSDQLGYDISYVDGSLNILKASLGITAADVTKTYDGTTSASGSLLISSGGLLGGDTIGGGSFAFANRNAGTGKTLTVSGVTLNDGNGGNNYDVSYVDNTNSSINKASLSVSAADASKVYDGTTNASSTALIIGGSLFGADSFNGATVAFADKNAGSGKHLLISSAQINDGNNGANYDVTYVDNTSSTITKKLLTISAVADSKVYDGRTWSTAAPVVSGRARGDSIAGLTQAYVDKNAGTGKTINVNAGYTIRDGNNGNNYDVVLVISTAGVITPKAITISTVAISKVYDGGVTSANKPLVTGLIAGDRITGLFQQYETKTVGESKKLLIKNGYVLQDGNNGSNYTVTEQASNDGVITAH